jgi:hypothetical protein
MVDSNTNNRLDSIERRLDSIENTLEKVVQNFNKLYVAVVGNETFDQDGIVQRLKKVETEVNHWHKLRLKLVGVFLGGGVAWTVLWELAKKFVIK